MLRMYGVTDAGNSVLAHIHGFTPYFWTAPPASMTEADVPAFQAALESTMAGARAKSRVPVAVLSVELVPGKQSLLGYHYGRTQNMLKIYVAMPSMVPTAKGSLERGMSFGHFPVKQYVCFEANVPFTLRYMIDNSISGCCWCEAPGGTYAVRPASRKVSNCQLELDIVYDSLISHPPDGPWQRVAPLRVLSFDIECMGKKGAFPDAQSDPVIQVANVVTLQGSSTSIIRNVFTLGTCTPIVGAQVLAHEKEEGMLEAWAAFVREADPDIITGYNVQNFDLPYLLNRMAKLKVDKALYLGRIKNNKATMKDSTFQSSAYGKSENVDTTIDGRVTFDMLQYVRREHKLSSYSLNSVSAHFLGQQKEDVHHSIISDLQMGSADDRRRLAVYCIKDAFLPQKLMDKLMVIINHIEMARVTGVPLDFLLSRGQQIKVVSMLYRKCRPLGLLVPTLPKQASGGGGGDDEGYEGATVIEPVKGYYDEPIATLDFASLYPSIMMAHNLCYSTLIANDEVGKLSPEDYEKTPDEEIYFIRSKVRGGGEERGERRDALLSLLPPQQ